MVLNASDSGKLVSERVHRSATATVAAGCHNLSFQAMNTLCRVQFYTGASSLAREFQREALDWVAGFEARYSRFIADSTRDGTGKVPDTTDDFPDGGFPRYPAATAPLDTDHDGMPDWWEKQHGLNPNDPADANGVRNGDGYTNLEQYLYGLLP